MRVSTHQPDDVDDSIDKRAGEDIVVVHDEGDVRVSLKVGARYVLDGQQRVGVRRPRPQRDAERGGIEAAVRLDVGLPVRLPL